MPNLISPTEYARQRCVHHTTVLKAIRTGRITLINGKIDPEVANIQWEKNTRPRMDFPKTSPVVPAPKDIGLPLPKADALIPAEHDLRLARAKREYHEANIAEMRYRQKAGELVELHQVTLAYTALAAQLRAALERIPDKLSSRLAAESDPHAIHILLTQELDQSLEDMAKEAEIIPEKLIEQPT